MSVQCLQLLGVAVKAAACLGEGDLPGAAVKQLEPQLMLQLPDLLGQGRLGDVEGVCRSSKALLFSNGSKALELMNGHEKYSYKFDLIDSIREMICKSKIFAL